jgi:single-stranded-DNA-specific exonuclease
MKENDLCTKPVSVHSTNRWTLLKKPDPASVKALADQINGDKVIASLLMQRGVRSFEEARAFFRPSSDQLHDPFLMKDMDKAVERIGRAISKKEKILVFGDYDVDGTTAVALMYTFLRTLDADCTYYIPDRYAEGYGISFAGIDFAKENNHTLIIALDCGIKSHDKVKYAAEREIDFIICDHHRPGDTLPHAVAVLDPKRSDCTYPYDELCGCGIGFKLAQALAMQHQIPFDQVLPLLDLVAVAIAADLVPITGENRVLVSLGLAQINQSPRPGFQAMLKLANTKRAVSVNDVVFIFAPRINAAGRIDHGRVAVNLLTSADTTICDQIAQAISKNNSDRRDIDKAITQQAIEQMQSWSDLPTRKSTVVYRSDWHKGVVGIVASRLIEKKYCPTIVLTHSNGVVTGSARSVKDFDVYEAIEACSHLLIQFGGHKYAAGLTMKEENLNQFREEFERIVSSRIKPEQLTPEIEIDLDLPLYEINSKRFQILKQFAPFGPGNMNPVFIAKQVCDRGWARIVGENHLKMDMIHPQDPNSIYPAIGFGLARFLPTLAHKNEMDICYSIEENEWNGKVSLQLNVKDIR